MDPLDPVNYKPPRRINVVSVTLVALLALGVYLAYQYLPLYLLRQEVFRILEETGSAFVGSKGQYLASDKKRENLRTKMESEVRRVGVTDPDLETWIEVDEPEVRFGAMYSTWIDWPFDIIERTERVYEVEHVVIVRHKRIR